MLTVLQQVRVIEDIASGRTTDTTFTTQVQDVNDNQPQFAASGYQKELVENELTGSNSVLLAVSVF